MAGSTQSLASGGGGGDPESGSFAVGPPGFDLIEEIGRGGMGVVYRACDLALDREVAVKLLSDRYDLGSGVARRFVTEARVTAQLQHPGIPPVYHVGTTQDGRPFLAMKLVKGDTLDRLLKGDGLLDPLAVFESVAQAVAYAHARGVVHRDLKPGNVMVGTFGEVQVMDWGLAKVAGSPCRDRLDGDPESTLGTLTEIRPTADSDDPFTEYGCAMGTPWYMPPEQAAGELEKVGPASDVFGLGAVLCVLLTGKPPFAGTNAEQVRLAAVRCETADAFARLDGCGADPAVVELCKRCLAFDPADRPADAAAVTTAVAELRRAADDRARCAEVDRARADGRRRATAWASGVVAAVLVLGLGGTLTGLRRANAARQVAQMAEQATAAQLAETEAARQREVAERAAAVKSAYSMNTTLEFLEKRVFAAAQPRGVAGGRGHDVSLRVALTAGLTHLPTDLGDCPLVEARLRSMAGKTYWYLGEFHTAIMHLERAREHYRDLVEPDHPDLLTCTSNLARCYMEVVRPADSLRLIKEVLAIRQRNLPREHPELLSTISQLASALQDMGETEDALRLAQEVQAARRRVLPADHHDVLASDHAVGLCLYNIDRYAAAAELLPEVLDCRRRVLGPEHPDTFHTANVLAMTYEAMGRHTEALSLFAGVLADRRRVLGSDHPDTIWNMQRTATGLVAVGRGSEAVPLIDECLALATGQAVMPEVVPGALAARLMHFRQTCDPAGCRATAELAEGFEPTAAADCYNAACFRAVAAGLYAKNGQQAEAVADADKAVAWLASAVAAGYCDRGHIDGDTNLDPLWGRADFQRLVRSLPEVAPLPRVVRR